MQNHESNVLICASNVVKQQRVKTYNVLKHASNILTIGKTC